MQRTSIVFIALSALLVTACGGNNDAKPTARVAVTSDQPTFVDDRSTYSSEGYVFDALPAHLIDQPVTIAIMLPLSGNNAPLGEAMLNAATMALIDAYDERLTLLPFDTKGTYAGAAAAAIAVVDANVDVVLGPLFGASMEAAGPIINDAGLLLIGFSSDSAVARYDRFTMGFTLENEVDRVLSYSVDQGHTRFAALLPEGVYGRRAGSTFGDIIEQNFVELTAQEFYPPDASLVFDPTARLANYAVRKKAMDNELSALRAIETDMTDDIADELEKQEVIGEPDFTAVLIPEGGDLLRTIAPLLPFYEVDPLKVQFLGTGLWNDPSLMNEPPLHGGWFAAPDPNEPNAFFERYRSSFMSPAPRIATIAYDATALAAHLARNPIVEERFTSEALLAAEGFKGIDGLFRFKRNGLAERGLAIIEISRGGFNVIDAAPTTFSRF